MAAIGALGAVDLYMGYELAFSLFYLLPIAYFAWFVGRRAGSAAAVVCSLVWVGADTASGHPYSSPWIPAWNNLIRLAFFMIIVQLLAALRLASARERALARTDGLTGAWNARHFYDLAQQELDRLGRYGRPFSLVYLDLDNFKAVNDRWGHAAGDEVLRAVVAIARARLRRNDVVARLGGDEFALLLPETDEGTVRPVCEGLRAGLLAAMRDRGWPVTFSLGVLTCRGPLPGVDELVRRADALMYEVKRASKDAIRYAVHGAGG